MTNTKVIQGERRNIADDIDILAQSVTEAQFLIDDIRLKLKHIIIFYSEFFLLFVLRFCQFNLEVTSVLPASSTCEAFLVIGIPKRSNDIPFNELLTYSTSSTEFILIIFSAIIIAIL